MAKVQCPTCGNAAPLPDSFLGRRVRCKACNNPFLATSVDGVRAGVDRPLPPPPAGVTASQAAALPPPPVPGVTASQAGLPPPAPPVTVVARRRAAPSGARFAWLAAGALAMLLPGGVAGGVLLLRGRVGGPGAERYACIEVGSSSVKFTCFEVFAYPDGTYDTAVVASGTEKSALVDGLAKMGRFDGEELDRVARAVQAYRDKLEQEHGVPADRIVVVGSGGLLGPIRDRDLEAGAKEKLMRAAEQALAAAVRKATGSAIDVVTPEREIAYQIKGAVRKADRSDALFLDIGGGASRFGYVRPSGTVQYYTEDGVKSFLGKVKGSVGKAKAKMKGKAKPGKAAAAAWLAALAKSELRDPIRARAEADRDLVVREKLYCSGGIMWVLATTMRPRECAEPPEKVAYVTLTVKDLEDFVDRVRDDPKFLDSFQVPAGLSDEQRARVEDDIKKMRKFFTSEWLLSGAAVVEAFTKELELGKKKEIKFFRLGENAWQMGYIVDRLK